MHIGVQNENQAKYIKYNSWQSKGIKHRALTKAQFIVHELVPLLTRGIAHFTRMEILTHSTRMEILTHSTRTEILTHYTQTGILYGRQFAFSGYFTVGACRRMGEEDNSIFPGKHVRILR